MSWKYLLATIAVGGIAFYIFLGSGDEKEEITHSKEGGVGNTHVKTVTKSADIVYIEHDKPVRAERRSKPLAENEKRTISIQPLEGEQAFSAKLITDNPVGDSSKKAIIKGKWDQKKFAFEVPVPEGSTSNNMALLITNKLTGQAVEVAYYHEDHGVNSYTYYEIDSNAPENYTESVRKGYRLPGSTTLFSSD